ncbi:MAG: TIGR00341 family protein [Rhodospirillales bacterium]|nr:TIGR00341 family protein [Rhodospirillales bacterium]
MAFRLIQILAPKQHAETIVDLAEKTGVGDIFVDLDALEERVQIRLVVGSIDRQKLLDRLQFALRNEENWKIVVMPVEAVIPFVEEEDGDKDKKKSKNKLPPTGSISTREEMYQAMVKGCAIDTNFVTLAVLSTVVAAIGLMQDSVAVVIGAMVIAPLLGPNIALAFSTAIGDSVLMINAMKTNIVGLTISLVLSAMIPLFVPINMESVELMARTTVGFDGVALALASGAAAALSVTTGLSSTLVGVMVAVALLPPTATLGMMISLGETQLAWGALTLLAVNIVCVNLSANLVFVIKKIHPRTWYEKEKAKKSIMINILMLVVLLACLSVIILLNT